MCQQTLVPTALSLGLTPGHLRGAPGPQLGGAGLRRSGWGISQCTDHSQFKGLIKQWVKVLLVLLGFPGGQLRELMPGFQGQLDKGVAGAWQVAREETLLAKDDTPNPECSPPPSSGALPASTPRSWWARGNAPSAQELGGTRGQTRRAAGAASTHHWSPGAAGWRR